MSDWQPIATAPKDGETRLYAVEVHGAKGASWWEYYALYLDDDSELNEISGDPFTTWSLEDFTHWMPLPQPPAESPAHKEKA